MTVRTRVYELPITKAQVMVEDWADGTQTIALREDSSAIWGPKYEPTIDDDGDHIREFPGEVLTAEQMLESHDIEEYRAKENT